MVFPLLLNKFIHIGHVSVGVLGSIFSQTKGLRAMVTDAKAIVKMFNKKFDGYLTQIFFMIR